MLRFFEGAWRLFGGDKKKGFLFKENRKEKRGVSFDWLLGVGGLKIGRGSKKKEKEGGGYAVSPLHDFSFSFVL